VCGRFTSTTPISELAGFFDADTDRPDEAEKYNVAPTNDVTVVYQDENEQRRLDLMFWGLVPSWAESPAIGSRLINARSETVAVKPSFRSAFRRRRCLIPVDGFYEWVQVPERKKKQPVYITSTDGNPLAFAGIWESWRSKDGSQSADELRSCSIITGPPNEMIAPLHDRMPMILSRDQWAPWLDPSNDRIDELHSMLRPAPEQLLQWWTVSTAVNNVRHGDASLIQHAEIVADGQAEGQGRLL
jgi:putative SOS response-associated peptidase YedK